MSFQKAKIAGPDGKPIEVEIIPVNAKQEAQSTYLLADGTTVTIQSVVVQVARVPGVYDQDGNPQYVLRSQNVVSVVSPENLRQRGDTDANP